GLRGGDVNRHSRCTPPPRFKRVAFVKVRGSCVDKGLPSLFVRAKHSEVPWPRRLHREHTLAPPLPDCTAPRLIGFSGFCLANAAASGSPGNSLGRSSRRTASVEYPASWATASRSSCMSCVPTATNGGTSHQWSRPA